MKRRQFVQQTSTVLAGSSFLSTPLISKSIIGANDKIGLGVIGCNGMGWSNTYALLQSDQIELLGICDVDENVRLKRKEDLKDFRSNTPELYGDYRKLLENKDIDAVVIGTPDHWHCKMMVDALQAGKHVYVEKPAANTIEECNIMLRASEKYNKQVVQVGQWQRSGPHYRQAMDIVQSGNLGNIRLVKVWAYQGWMKPVPVYPNERKAPKGVDYDMWLGMAPKRPFNKNRFHFNFRWFWDYAGGLMTDWGVHEIDIALFAMGAKAPISVMASGGKLAYPNDASETPDTLQTIFEYKDFNMLWEHGTGINNGNYNRDEGIAFIGNNGTLVLDRQGFEVIQEFENYGNKSGAKMENIKSVDRPKDVNYLVLHAENFIEAMNANDASILNTPISSGATAAINAQMGNIAYKTKRKVFWDQDAGSFINDDHANALMKARYFNGWQVPSI